MPLIPLFPRIGSYSQDVLNVKKGFKKGLPVVGQAVLDLFPWSLSDVRLNSAQAAIKWCLIAY